MFSFLHIIATFIFCSESFQIFLINVFVSINNQMYIQISDVPL